MAINYLSQEVNELLKQYNAIKNKGYDPYDEIHQLNKNWGNTYISWKGQPCYIIQFCYNNEGSNEGVYCAKSADDVLLDVSWMCPDSKVWQPMKVCLSDPDLNFDRSLFGFVNTKTGVYKIGPCTGKQWKFGYNTNNLYTTSVKKLEFFLKTPKSSRPKAKFNTPIATSNMFKHVLGSVIEFTPIHKAIKVGSIRAINSNLICVPAASPVKVKTLGASNEVYPAGFYLINYNNNAVAVKPKGSSLFDIFDGMDYYKETLNELEVKVA